MLEIRRILCAVDLLKPALTPLRYAVWLTGVFKTAQLDPLNASLAASARQRALSSNARKLEQIMLQHNGREKLDRSLEGVAQDVLVRSTSHVLPGKPVSAILAHAEVSNVDLIVPGIAAGAPMRGGGSTSAHLLTLAASEAYDLIVMGLHSDGGRTRISAGGVGSAMRLRSSIPVFSVRASDSQLTLHAGDLLDEPSFECSLSAVQSREAVRAPCLPH